MLAGALMAVCLSPATTSEDHLLELVNQYRAICQLKPLRLHQGLCQAADGHANFMSVNNVLSHFESASSPAFTGTDLEARANKVGWNDALSELVGYASTNIEDSVQAVFDSPCHRSRFLKPGSLELGASARGNFVCLLIGGDPEPSIVVSPAPGQVNVPLSWSGTSDLSGTKTGFGSRRTGYPIVFVDSFFRGKALKLVSAQICKPDGTAVATLVKDPSNDHHYSDSVALFPETPLEPHTEYTVTVNVEHPDGKVVFRTWSFQTTANNSR